MDDETDTHGDPRMECVGLGVSNVFVGLFGGIAGCGMVGQTVGNLRYGGQGRLSTFTAGAFLLFLMVMLHTYVARIPMAALVAIMCMVSISTFSWSCRKDQDRESIHKAGADLSRYEAHNDLKAKRTENDL